MAKSSLKYVCQECGAITQKWAGQCLSCNAWNSIAEEASGGFTKANQNARRIEFESLKGEVSHTARVHTGLAELDRVLGGGLVKASAILIGGDPGIGKSTLLLQLVANLSRTGLNCVYVTGEESIDQVRLRANRLGVETGTARIATATSVSDLLASFRAEKAPDAIIIDSIQTMYLDSIDSAPGTVSQVRSSAYELINLAKSSGAALFLVGHVTKEGQIAGPKVLEHMVDTVLYFEGERGAPFRILRAVKNRFGGANEIGVFEMTDKGLAEVANPSALFISGAAGNVAGSAIFAGMEGTRPVLVEIQALVSPTTMATPRRAVVGWDTNRLAMVLAVLSRHCGIQLSDKEVYLNVAGGLKINEPAADLAVAAAILSSLANIPLPAQTVIFGELGLSGEVRPVGYAQTRLKEAEKLGFARALLPESAKNLKGFAMQEITFIRQLSQIFAPST